MLVIKHDYEDRKSLCEIMKYLLDFIKIQNPNCILNTCRHRNASGLSNICFAHFPSYVF